MPYATIRVLAFRVLLLEARNILFVLAIPLRVAQLVGRDARVSLQVLGVLHVRAADRHQDLFSTPIEGQRRRLLQNRPPWERLWRSRVRVFRSLHSLLVDRLQVRVDGLAVTRARYARRGHGVRELAHLV